MDRSEDNPGDGSERSEKVSVHIWSQRNNHNHILNPCPHCKLCSYLHISKSELVYKNHIKKVKLLKCDINWSVFYKF